MDNLSPYEKQRLKNIEENKKVLASLGLLNGVSRYLKIVEHVRIAGESNSPLFVLQTRELVL